MTARSRPATLPASPPLARRRDARCYRNIRATTVAEGTSEVQKHIIARELGCFESD